jgi:dipeptidyl aminopeptidase/acylaminoacyl peptidase
MTTKLTLTDEMIRSALTRRATGGDARNLRERVFAATADVSQQRGWRVSLGQIGALRQRRATLTLAVAVALLLATALVVALVGSQIDRPTPSSLGRLAYFSDGDLYVAERNGASPRLVWDLPATGDLATRQLAWLDPETVLLHSFTATDGGVSVVDVASGAHRLLDTGDLVALSPDRRLVAIQTFEEGSAPKDRVRLIDIASGAVVGEIPGRISGYPPQWSPDGRSILGESPDSIDRVDIATGERIVLATGLCCGLSPHWPTWAPDGTRVVYVDYHLPVSATDCRFRCGTLWAVSAAGGGNPTRLTPEFGSEILPTPSPDGRWIAYVDESTNNLVLIAADGSGARVLAPDPLSRPGLDSVPGVQFRWDPDSAGITYLTKVATLWHVTLSGVATQLEGSAISEFARQVVP